MTPNDFDVFKRYLNAPANAFGSKNNPKSLVTDDDKASYARIHDALIQIASSAITARSLESKVKLRKMNFSPTRGARGHRPIDLWVSLCGIDSDLLGKMPQIYIIASVRGVEIGFAVSISEADYHDPQVKARNRTLVPLINSKLPGPTSPLIGHTQDLVRRSGGWHFNEKARLTSLDAGFGRWTTLRDMVSELQTSRIATGGGSIVKYLPTEDVSADRLAEVFGEAVDVFLPLLLQCQAPDSELKYLENEEKIDKESEAILFVPDELEDARKKILRQIAVRRGQAKFRAALLDAYDRKCVVSRVNTDAVLEAAHIVPFKGDKTNVVQNGILLTGDIHTLFDLGLVRFNPEDLSIHVSDILKKSAYYKYHGQSLHLPADKKRQPSKDALEIRWVV